MKSLTIKTHSSDKREYEFFQAILTLAGSVLTHDWRIVEDDPADVVIISFDSTEPYSAWDEYAGKYPPERLVAYTDENLIIGAKWHLQRAPEAMPRLSEVVKVLNSVGRYLSESGIQALAIDNAGPSIEPMLSPFNRPKSNPDADISDQVNGSRFCIQHHLAGVLQKAIQQEQCLVCLMPGNLPVYICPRENAVYTAEDLRALSALCRAPVDSINITNLLEEELREEVAFLEWVKRRSLSEFMWFSILTGSNGRLLADHCEMEPIHLKEWPGHVRLSFYSMYHDIATQMASGIASLGEIARMSAAPIQNVIDFYNACAHFELIARGEEARHLADQKIMSRDRLRAVLKPFFADNRYLKLVVVGSVGAGKTTALTTLSETPPVMTEASPSDAVASSKATTTVAMEYGEFCPAPDSKLQIYGTPGQKRFDFMGQILSSRAWGLLILIDNTGPHPMAELKYYIDQYSETIVTGGVAIGISHFDTHQKPSIEDYENFLAANGYPYSLGGVDARDLNSLVSLISGIARQREPAESFACAVEL